MARLAGLRHWRELGESLPGLPAQVRVSRVREIHAPAEAGSGTGGHRPRRAGVRGGPGQGGCQEGDSPVDQASVVAERGAGEDQGEPGDCPQAEPERDGDQSRAPRDRAPTAQAAAVTTTLTMGMTVYPCGNVTAAPDPWMLVVSAGRKETAGRRAPGAWRGQPGRACSGLMWSRPGFGCQRGSSDCPSWESAVRLPGGRAADRALTATLGRAPEPGDRC
jgi:hypothetical protein